MLQACPGILKSDNFEEVIIILEPTGQQEWIINSVLEVVQYIEYYYV